MKSYWRTSTIKDVRQFYVSESKKRYQFLKFEMWNVALGKI